MTIYKELSPDQDIDKVWQVQFCILSPEQIRARSVVAIQLSYQLTGDDPVHNGLFDPRMGVTENNKTCPTCDQKNSFCPGHFGHIELAKPVFYYTFFDIVKKLLHCVCFRCSALLVPVADLYAKKIINKKMSRQKRFEAVYKHCNNKKSRACVACGAIQPYSINNKRDQAIGRVLMEWKPEEAPPTASAIASMTSDTDAMFKQVFYAEDVLPILKRITKEDAEAMGFSEEYNRPEWMICTVFLVPPPAVRPSVRHDTGQRSEDDLTSKLREIVKWNNILKTKLSKNVTRDQIEHQAALLQYHIATFSDNQISNLLPSQHRNGRPHRSLRERLKGKEGRIRGNLMGKRVDFSARSVITPDPNLSIDELGVPLKIAMNMTIPEIVNRYNRAEMMELLRNGPYNYPGARYLRKTKENNVKILKGRKTDEKGRLIIDDAEVEDGDIVDRHLRNGDWVLFNRQPSLHKMSMMAFHVRVMPYDTFRLNVCVTPSFNADKHSMSATGRCL
jgi:DNA-directed RNA polymerase II subunit RPB1